MKAARAGLLVAAGDVAIQRDPGQTAKGAASRRSPTLPGSHRYERYRVVPTVAFRTASRYERGGPARNMVDVVASSGRSFCVASPAVTVITFAVSRRRENSLVSAMRSAIAVV